MDVSGGQVDNHRELRVVGMSRSGNHAIINWILRQAPGRYCFLNCCQPKTNPFRSARPDADGDYYLERVQLHIPAISDTLLE